MRMYETKDACEDTEILALCILLSLSNNIRDSSGRRVHYRETKLFASLLTEKDHEGMALLLF